MPLTENPFLSLFYERYKDDFHLNVKRESCQRQKGFEGASKPRSGQEQEQEQDKDLSGHGSAPQMVDPPMKLHLKSRKAVTRRNLNWLEEYPKRAGGNSKVDAFKARTARIKSGATAQELTDGVRRYADYVTAAGKLNTEYVKQASTFSVLKALRGVVELKYQPVNGIRTQYPSQIN